MIRYKSKKGQEHIHERQNILTSYGSTHIIITGIKTNPPLLLFHGVGDNSAMMWLYNIERLYEHFYVIAVDAIGGSGRSEPNEHYYRSFDQTIWLDEILEHLQMDEVNIAEVSYGAYLAYHYAIMRPFKVRKIVCMAGRVASRRGNLKNDDEGIFSGSNLPNGEEQ